MCDTRNKMTTANKWFIAAAIFGALFLVQIVSIARLNEEAAVLQARIDEVSDPFSGKAIGSYCKAFFDGFTLGEFADEGIFTESKKMEREIAVIRDAWASLTSRYETATWYRNISLVGSIICIAIAVVIGRKQAKRMVQSLPAE
jgi:hypothetical protein